MFNNPTADGLHPNAQGDLLMAGNLAKGMGYAGRSAGQERKATHELEVNFGQNPSITQQTLEANGFTANNVSISNNTVNFNKSGSSTLTYNWGAAQGQNKGYTVDFTLRLGNGATDGWDTTNNFSLNLGNGTLNINEAYIQWGSTILYSKDMSANADAIRIAYVAGDSANGLDAGYYIWLGDVLIGEAQTAAGGKFFRPHVQLFRHAGRHPVQSGFGRFPFLRPLYHRHHWPRISLSGKWRVSLHSQTGHD